MGLERAPDPPAPTFTEREARRLKAALHAAVDADTFVALVKGEPVPADRLEQRTVQHHLLRTNPKR